MKKRVNSTGRKKLSSDNIDICISTLASELYPTFTANIDLSSITDLDKTAKVYVEPYVRTSSMRFDFGTVADLKAPEDTIMSELDRTESILFRVKVVDESGTVGRILAAANGLRPRGPGEENIDRKSLLPLVIKDLGEMVWNVDYDPDSGPFLQISNRIPGLSGKLKSDPLLQGVIYPMAFREVLLKLMPEGDADEDAPWTANWRTFIKELTGRDIVDNEPDDDADTFVEAAVRAFSDRHHFVSKAIASEEATL